MTCYSPLKAIVLGINDNGKKNLKILPTSYFNANFDRFIDDGFECLNIPCGHCIGCRLEYSRVWADRCMAESLYHSSNYFITLTYNNDHLPARLVSTLADGSVSVSPVNPLVKRDVQLFIKRLRKETGQKIRYYLCGEYGSSTMRPHYHLLLFGLVLDDLKPLYVTDEGFSYFTSDLITKLWYREGDANISDVKKRSAGFHIITSVNWNTCAYVARYIVKKQYGKGALCYDVLNYPPEFTLMSRKPGIGYQFYEDHKYDLYSDYSDVYLPLEDGKHHLFSNKYYDYLYDLEYPDHFAVISDERKAKAIIKNELKQKLTDKQYIDILKSEELYMEDRLKSLKRGDVYVKE